MTTKDKYIASFNRYYQEYTQEFDTAKQAAQFLLQGESDGEMSWNDITYKGKVIAKNQPINWEELYRLGASNDEYH